MPLSSTDNLYPSSNQRPATLNFEKITQYNQQPYEEPPASNENYFHKQAPVKIPTQQYQQQQHYPINKQPTVTNTSGCLFSSCAVEYEYNKELITEATEVSSISDNDYLLSYVYEKEKEGILPGAYAKAYRYLKSDTPIRLAEKYFIRFNEEWSENHTEPEREYVVRCHNCDGDFEVYPYGLSPDKAKLYLTPYGNPEVSAYYHYNSISEQGSIENQVLFEGGESGEENGRI